MRTSCPGFVVFVTYAAPCTLSNYAGNADSRIFSRTGNRVYGRGAGDENKFLERDTDNLFNLVLLRLRRPLVWSCRREKDPLLQRLKHRRRASSRFAAIVGDRDDEADGHNLKLLVMILTAMYS